jgi:hypothetical protein
VDEGKIVVPLQSNGAPLRYEIGTGFRVRTVSYQIAEKVDIVGCMGIDVLQDRRKGFEVGMNV